MKEDILELAKLFVKLSYEIVKLIGVITIIVMAFLHLIEG